MNKQNILPLAVLSLIALGGATISLSKLSSTAVHAQSPSAQVSQVPVGQQVTDKADTGTEVADNNKQAPAFTSSIRVPETTQEMDAVTEAKQLTSLAKISTEQAKVAAEKSVGGGTASTVKLEEEHGNVVYAVTVGTKEVKVDAGNGNILHTETAEAGDTKETAGTEAN